MALYAAYAFDEGTGTTAADASGNSRNLTIASGHWSASGHTSNCLISTNNSAGSGTFLPSSTGFTLMAWCKFTSFAAWQSIIQTAQGDYWEVSPTAQWDFYSAGANFNPTASGTLTSNTWYHLAVTGATTGGFNLYTNGTNVFTGGTSLPAATAWTTAEFCGSGESPGNMLMDDLRVYDTVLTGAEITTLMGTPVTGGGGGPTFIASRPRVINTALTRAAYY